MDSADLFKHPERLDAGDVSKEKRRGWARIWICTSSATDIVTSTSQEDPRAAVQEQSADDEVLEQENESGINRQGRGVSFGQSP